VCSHLFNNALNGSVPSSLSALTNLESLFVPPSSLLLPMAFARAAEEGRIGSALLRAARHVGGMHVGGIERGRCGSRAVAVLSEGTLGTRCD
jgi:hypothetical protein